MSWRVVLGKGNNTVNTHCCDRLMGTCIAHIFGAFALPMVRGTTQKTGAFGGWVVGTSGGTLG